MWKLDSEHPKTINVETHILDNGVGASMEPIIKLTQRERLEGAPLLTAGLSCSGCMLLRAIFCKRVHALTLPESVQDVIQSAQGRAALDGTFFFEGLCFLGVLNCRILLAIRTYIDNLTVALFFAPPVQYTALTSRELTQKLRSRVLVALCVELPVAAAPSLRG